MRGVNPMQKERDRDASARLLRVVASSKRIASAAGVSERYAQMMCAGERGNAIGNAAELMRALVREGGRVWRAVEYLESEIMGAEMDVRDVAPETDYQAALQDLHDQASAALPKLLAEIRGEPDPVAMHEAALDVAEAARVLMVRARKLASERRAKVRSGMRVAS